MRYELVGDDGKSVQVDAVDWMMAMCSAIEKLGIEVSGWVCETRADGIVIVTDPVSHATWSVAPAPEARPGAPASLPPTPMRLDYGGEAGPPDDLAEKLFDLSFDLSMADSANDACHKALEICLQLVPAEAGSVLRGTINDDVLTFVAVSGPAANDLVGRQLRFGEGLVGACFDLGITIQVNDVAEDPRFMSEIDNETGFQTRTVLCVPVRTDDEFHGAIQLLNPPRRFVPWHVDAVEQIAKSLAATLEASGA